jgi:hypothetical protein
VDADAAKKMMAHLETKFGEFTVRFGVMIEFWEGLEGRKSN